MTKADLWDLFAVSYESSNPETRWYALQVIHAEARAGRAFASRLLRARPALRKRYLESIGVPWHDSSPQGD